MNAAVLTKLNSPLEIEYVTIGKLSYGQVLVKVLASGICGAQLQEIAGLKGNAKFLPHLLGHEACGIVQDVGIGVTKVKAGEKVVMHWRKGDGIESEFPKYTFRGNQITSGKLTTFSDYTIASENRVTPVPSETPVELCALLGCGLSTALGTVERDAHLRLGESVLIVGVGGLGVNLIRAASLVGAVPIAACDIHEEKREIAIGMGAHAFFQTAQICADVIGEQGRKGFDCIIDTSGSPAAIRHTLQYLGPTGRFIMVGQPAPGVPIELMNANHMFGGEGKTIKATQGGGFNPSEDIPRYVRAHKAGMLKLDGIITDRIPLKDINAGIDKVRNGHASRVLIEME